MVNKMKMKMKIGIISALMVSSSFASAHLSEDAAQEIINGNSQLKEKWLKKAEHEDFMEHAIISIQSLVGKNNPLNISEHENLIIELMSKKYKLDNKWGEKNNIIENSVWQNNSLIDLDRVQLGTVKFPTINAYSTIQYDMSSEKRMITGQKLSSTLMRQGHAPIGPDGKSIKLCRLINHPSASFYEMSEYESHGFIKYSYSFMDVNQACIEYKSSLAKYWQKRRLGYLDENNVQLKMPR
jgi:hypothetical protein